MNLNKDQRNRKQRIENAFGNKALSYDTHAILQQECAEKIYSFLPQTKPLKILEIGCGTGFLTQKIQRKYPNASILGVDISSNMVKACQQKFIGYQNIDFQIADGESFNTNDHYDLIVSNLCVQWFENPMQGLQNLTNLLTNDGTLIFSTVGKKSFREWKSTLSNLNLPSGILNIPDYNCIFKEEIKTIQYKDSYDFLRSFKNIGAHTPRANYTPLSAAQLRQACADFDIKHQGTISWHILYGALNASGSAALANIAQKP